MRPTIKTTIGKHQVEYYEYMTPRELHAIHEFNKKNPNEESKTNEMLLKSLVVAVDGSTENILDAVLDGFRLEEYVELQERIAELVDTKKKLGTQ